MSPADSETRSNKCCKLQLERCCFFIPLQLGVKIIGLAELVVSVGLLIVTNLIADYPEVSRKPSSEEVLYLNYTALVDGLLAAYLLLGLCQGKENYYKTWSVAQSVHLIASFVIVGWRNLHDSQQASTTMAITEFLITTVLDGYFILVVYSYYRQCKHILTAHSQSNSVVI